MLQSGQRIGGKYQLVRQLGEGGMGVVWEATNLAIERRVAIKLMRPELTRHDQSLQRFFNEARVCGKIRHRGIVDVLDLGRAEDGSPFLVMELLEGVELDALMAQAGCLSPGSILPIVRDAARTVELAHEQGVVHRDLKPSNLFLHRAERRVVVKVLDFGVSKIIDDARGSKLTRTGMVLGTPAYMSPEQAGGRISIDHRADIYSLGVILFEGLAGRLPFEGPTPNAFLIDIATKDAPRVTGFRSDLPAAIADLVADCLERNREKRIATAARLADRIDEVMRAADITDEIQTLDLRALAARPAKRQAAPWSVSTFESDRLPVATALDATLPASGPMRSADAAATSASPLSTERLPPPVRRARWRWALPMLCLLVAAGGGFKLWLDARSDDGLPAAAASSEAAAPPIAGAAEVAPVTTASAQPPSVDPSASAGAQPTATSVAAEPTTKQSGASPSKPAQARPSSSPVSPPAKSAPTTPKPTDVWGYD